MAIFCPLFPNKDKFSDYEPYDGFGVPTRRPPPPAQPASSSKWSACLADQRLYASLSALDAAAVRRNQRSPASSAKVVLGERWSPARDLANVKPYTEARAVEEFRPTVDDEIEVMAGEMVKCLYKEEDWLYVRRADHKEGFVPSACCELRLPVSVDSPLKKSANAFSPGGCTAADEVAVDRGGVASIFVSAPAAVTTVTPPEKKGRTFSGSLRRALPYSLLKYRSKSQGNLKMVKETDDVFELSETSPPSPAKPNLLIEQSPEAMKNVARFLDSLVRKPSLLHTDGEDPQKDVRSGEDKNASGVTSEVFSSANEASPEAPSSSAASGIHEAVTSTPVDSSAACHQSPVTANGNEKSTSSCGAHDNSSAATLTNANSDPSDGREQTSTPKGGERADSVLTSALPTSVPFVKRCVGRYLVAFSFAGGAVDDLTVCQGQQVAVLNRDDADWYWVGDEFGAEGFVPTSYLLPVADFSDSDSLLTSSSTSCHSGSQGGAEQAEAYNGADPGPELFVTRDFTPESADDLHVVKGDWVYSRQKLNEAPGGWLWAYSARTQRFGFVPAAFVKPPVSTVL